MTIMNKDITYCSNCKKCLDKFKCIRADHPVGHAWFSEFYVKGKECKFYLTKEK